MVTEFTKHMVQFLLIRTIHQHTGCKRNKKKKTFPLGSEKERERDRGRVPESFWNAALPDCPRPKCLVS